MHKKKGKGAASGQYYSLQEAVALFLARYKKSSQETYGYNLKNFSDFMEGNPLIGDITPTHLLKYQEHVQGREEAGEIAEATRNTYLKMAKVFFNWLAKTALLDTSPARLLKIPRGSSAVEREKAMSHDELLRILEWAKWRPRDFALITFFADTGCRAGGAAGLRVQDIDFESMRAIVTEKGEKSRPVSFGSVCARALHVWLKKRPSGSGEYVFSFDGHAMLADSLSQAVRRACKVVGIRSLGSHAIRHLKGHEMAYGLVPPTLAAKAMGHSVRTYWDSYSPTSQTEVDAVMRKFAIKEEDVGRSSSPKSPDQNQSRPRLTILKKGG